MGRRDSGGEDPAWATRCTCWSLPRDQALDSLLVSPLPQEIMVSRRPLVALLLSPPILASASSAFVAPRAASFLVSASQRALASRRATVSAMPHRMASTQQPATTFSIDAPPAPGNPFHLAFPVRDIEESRKFYGDVLGCTQGRIGELLLCDSIQHFSISFTGLCVRLIPERKMRDGPADMSQCSGQNLVQLLESGSTTHLLGIRLFATGLATITNAR
jgi:hypothetical protein